MLPVFSSYQSKENKHVDSISGYIEKIVYRNQENGYTVLELNYEGDAVTCVGSFQYINEGEYMEATGNVTEHPSYGEQFFVVQYEIKQPKDLESIRRYLGSGAIKGIGAKMAERILQKFGEDTFRIMEEEPERLQEVKGISQKRAMEIAEQMEEKKEMRNAMMFLQKYGISNTLAVKIYHQYGDEMYTLLQENPYRMAEDIQGIGFKIADEIAGRAGIKRDSDFRIRSGILYTLQNAGANGHVYLPMEELVRQTAEILQVSTDGIERNMMDLAIDKRITIKTDAAGEKQVYAMSYYRAELTVASRLLDLNVPVETEDASLEERIRDIERRENIQLDEWQKRAVKEAVCHGLLVLTGGPGTGKTTTIHAIIKYFEAEYQDILLAAPTGRAAKRMTEATGYEARTIHRMLELSGNVDENKTTVQFERNEWNPLEADVIIIDEMSMVDIFLMQSLLKAISVGTRLILVGDINQLPSVGPGSVLKDIIDSGSFHTVKLNKIFRQASQSDIIVNAHKINKGEHVELKTGSRDFLFLKRQEANQVISAMITLLKEKLPKYVSSGMMELQVLTMSRKGLVGVERLNTILQEYLNPPDANKREHEFSFGMLREGDKVMQIKNNYQLEWEIRGKYGIAVEKGTGVFNGDTGMVRSMNLFSELIEVEYEDGRYVTYTFKQTDELELAYAITVHKSQGSEYPAVVIPMFPGPRMLMNRNLLYTAVTRARKCVCLVGTEEIFHEMVKNESEIQRFSGLAERIRECAKRQEEI